MSMRIAFDMDGVLADFESAFIVVERRLFGDDDLPAAEAPESRAEEENRQENLSAAAFDSESSESGDNAASSSTETTGDAPTPGESVARNVQVPGRRKLDKVWGAIEETPDFWAALSPLEPGGVRRIHDLMLRYRWEVFFITQRPRTAGDTVQRQTQRWLVEQGFDWPSVLVMPGPRGRAAGALHLDYLVDDSAKNCVDVLADSKAHPVLILRRADARTEASAQRLGITVVNSLNDALDLLERATERRLAQPSAIGRLARMVGWRS